MKLPVFFNQSLDRWSQYREGLSAREQRLLTVGLWFVGASVVWFVLIEPAWLTIQKAERSLPLTVEKAGTALQLAGEIKQLKDARPQGVMVDGPLKDALKQQLDQRQWGEKSTLSVVDDGVVTVTAQDLPVADALAWLEGVEKMAELKSLEITKTQAGIVKLKLDAQPRATAQAGR